MRASNKGGRGRCNVCSHPDRDAIDDALFGGGSMDTLAERYGISRSSLRRHKLNHPRRDLHKVDGSAQEATGQTAGLPIDVPAELQAQFERTLANVKAAERSRSHQAIDSANREHRLTLALLADWKNERDKLEILARPTGGVVNILQTSAWRETTVKIFKALAPFPAARIALSNALMTPEGQQEAN